MFIQKKNGRRIINMAAVKELIKANENGTLSFGDYTLVQKAKLDGFDFQGNLYKVKTFAGITKLERDGMFIYESVPGTAVEDFHATADGLVFKVSGEKDAQITVGLEAESEYTVCVNEVCMNDIKTNFSGKLSVSVELDTDKDIDVKIVKK